CVSGRTRATPATPSVCWSGSFRFCRLPDRTGGACLTLLLEPALRLVPAGGGGEALVGLGPRVPQLGRREAAGGHDPVGVAEVSGAVGGQLGTAAADQAVDPSGEAEQRTRGREADGAAADRLPERFREILVAPTAGGAVVRLDHPALRSAAGGQGDEQAGEVGDVDQ